MGEGTAALTFTIAVIPSRCRDSLSAALDSISPQVHRATVIVNNPETDSFPQAIRENVTYFSYGVDPPNISRLWNFGIEYAERVAKRERQKNWNVVILNDDVEVPPNFVHRLDSEMRSTTAILAYPDQFGTVSSPCMHVSANPIDIRHRITGYAFMLRGEAGIKLDPKFGWWYGDDDLDWRCRQAGGSLMVPGCAVVHKHPNGYTVSDPRLTAQAGRDRETFQAKWGRTPH